MNEYSLFIDENPWLNISEPCYPEGYRLFLKDDRFWVSMNIHGQICFFVQDTFCASVVIPEKLAGVELEKFSYKNNSQRLLCTLTSEESELRNKFILVTKDIALKTKSIKSELLFKAVVDSIESWANFLKPQRTGLSDAEYIGFWGELYVFNMHFLPNLGAELSLLSWVGPEGKKQDFTLNNLAIEVKTSFSSNARRIKISSMEQLEKVTERLFLLHVIANPSGDNIGLSLKNIYTSCKEKLKGNMQAEIMFEQKIKDLYNKATDRQLTSKNLLISEILFEVTDNFPQIKQEDIPDSVLSLEYEIAVSALQNFKSQKNIAGLIKHG